VAGAARTPNPQPQELTIRASRVIIDGGERSAAISIRDGTIVAIEDIAVLPSAPRVVTLGDDVVLIPGLVDTHVHVNEPGRTEWEGFETATAAAAAAGVLTIVDMPLNSLPPTLTAEALAIKRMAAGGRCHVDVGFWGGSVPTNTESLPELLRAGVFGVKCFLQDSGVPEFPPLSVPQLHRAMTVLADLRGLMLVHAEDPGVLRAAPAPQGRSYAAFVNSRPDTAEASAIATVIAAAANTGCRAHIVHLSSAAGAQLVREAKAAGVPITAETCPHYLTLAAETIPDGSPQFKCCPPIRGRADQDALWAALADGTVDIVVTDHSPSTPALKRLAEGDLGLAWGGIASLQFGFAAVLTEAHRRGVPLADVLRWMSSGPAELAGLARKGGIVVGSDADLVVLADRETFTVTADLIKHKHPVTPYLDCELRGVVRTRWLRGIELENGMVAGRLLSAEPA